MIHRSGRSPRDVRSDRHLSSFTDDYSINLRRIATPQDGAEIMSILESITDNIQWWQITPLRGSLPLRSTKLLLQILECSTGEFSHPSQKALMLFRATQFRQSRTRQLLKSQSNCGCQSTSFVNDLAGQIFV
jgi:hypothetical protein